MRKSNHHELRQLLRSHPDGLTVKQMCEHTGRHDSATRRALLGMPDVYRDRWVVCHDGKRPIAVFVAVPVPDDCPPPNKSKKRSAYGAHQSR
jgi:hypothetical protein